MSCDDESQKSTSRRNSQAINEIDDAFDFGLGAAEQSVDGGFVMHDMGAAAAEQRRPQSVRHAKYDASDKNAAIGTNPLALSQR